MSIYGEMSDEFRPRPAWWRIALTSIGQFILAVSLTNLFVGIIDGVLLIESGIAKALIVHSGTWRSIAPLPGFDAEHAVIAVGLLILGVVIVDFLPLPRTLAMKHFAVVVAESLAAFGAVTIAIRQPAIAGVAIALAAAAVVWRAEIAAIRALNNVMDVKRPSRRVLVWLLRVGIFAALAAIPTAPRTELLFLGIVTLIVNLARKPRDEFEETLDPQLHEAAAVMPILAALAVAGLVWLTPRAIIVSPSGVSVRPWKPIVSDLAKRLRDRQTRH